ncbi:MAG: hypothetical protein ACKER6_00445 [Candidatus Hodgkinia cicadicola]
MSKLIYLPLVEIISKSLTFKRLYDLVFKYVVVHKEWFLKPLAKMCSWTGLLWMA